MNQKDIKDAVVEHWPDTGPVFATQGDANMFTDKQIKASTIGNYICESLTEAAQKQLKADQDFSKLQIAMEIHTLLVQAIFMLIWLTQIMDK